MAAARRAPSAGDCQSYRIVVVEDPETRAALAGAAPCQDFVAQAPVVLAFCAEGKRGESRHGRGGAASFGIRYATIAACHAQLAASALGLALRWVRAFDETAVAAALRGPGGFRRLAIMPIGWAVAQPQRQRRRPT